MSTQDVFQSSFAPTSTNDPPPRLVREAWEAHPTTLSHDHDWKTTDCTVEHHKKDHKHHSVTDASSSRHYRHSRRSHRRSHHHSHRHHSAKHHSAVDGHVIRGPEDQPLIIGGTRHHHHHSRTAHHHHHHHHHTGCRHRSVHAESSEMVENGEAPPGRDWVKERNRFGYKTRRSNTRDKITRDEQEFSSQPVYVNEFERQRRLGVPVPPSRTSRRHNHRSKHHNRHDDVERASNDFMMRDPAIHSVTFKRPDDRSSPSKSGTSGRSPSPSKKVLLAPRTEEPPISESARVGDTSLLPTSEQKGDHTCASRETSPSQNESLDLGVASSTDTGDGLNDTQPSATPEEETASPANVPKPETVPLDSVTKFLLERRAASEFIAGIEKGSDDERQTGVPEGLDVHDPLSALSLMKPVSDKLPTLLEDERARDEIIFQDEEFNFYRETNMPRGVNKAGEIRHVRTEADGSMSEMQRSAFDGTETEGIANVVPRPMPRRQGGPPPRLNYFVALRVTDPQIRRKVQSLQNRLVGMSGDFGMNLHGTCVDLNTLHMTLNMLHLGSDEMIFSVMDAFERFGQTTLQRLVPTKTFSKLTISGASTFKDRVLYARTVRDRHCDILENIAIALRTLFNECGVVRQSTRFDPHITIMKMSRLSSDSKRTFPKHLIEEAKMAASQFGCQYIHSLELCSLHDERDDDDYYTTVAQITPLKAF